MATERPPRGGARSRTGQPRDLGAEDYNVASPEGADIGDPRGGGPDQRRSTTERATQAASSAAAGLMSKVRETATSQVSAGKDRAADRLGSVADAVKQAGDQLRGQNATIASYVDMAVDQLQHLSTRLREKDPGEFLDDLEQFARQRPGVFVGTAFVLGLGLARFMKSSARQRQVSRGAQRANAPSPAGSGRPGPTGGAWNRPTGTDWTRDEAATRTLVDLPSSAGRP